MAPVLVALLDDAGEGDAAYLPFAERLLVLATHVLHALRVEKDLLMRHQPGEVDLQDGLLHHQQPGQLDAVVDEHAEGGVAGFRGVGRAGRLRRSRGGGGRDAVKDAVYAGDDGVGGVRRVGEALRCFAAEYGERRRAPLVHGLDRVGSSGS